MPRKLTAVLRKKSLAKKKLLLKQTEMLSLIDAKISWGSRHKITWKLFKKFSWLPENKTIFLWGKYHPLKNVKSQWRKYGLNKKFHPLLDLLLANKIYAERDKTMKQIASEVSELLSEKFDKPVKILPDEVGSLNKFLNIRKTRETERKGKWGGKRTKISKGTLELIKTDLRNLRTGEVAGKHKLDYVTVYRIGVNEGILMPKPNNRQGYFVPIEKRREVDRLLSERKSTLEEIAKKTGVSYYYVQTRKRSIKK